jgi:tRNA threonylcarbamoyl adenosine modification protein (Sua5/YciO/YrdC/YwlC family)
MGSSVIAPIISPGSSPGVVGTAALHPGDGLKEVVGVLERGGVIAFPTDTLYGIGCGLGRSHAIDRIQAMRQFDGSKRPLTFLLPDVGQVAHYAHVSESAYRILTRIFPGPFCAELEATSRVPMPFVHEERRTIGVRVPDSPLCQRLLWAFGKPILTATAKGRAGNVLTTAADIQEEYGDELDLIVDGGTLAGLPSTVVSLIDDWITVLREGRGAANKILMD